MKTIEQAKAAHQAGQEVFWQNPAYILYEGVAGDWFIACKITGHVTPLNGHKAEDFFVS